MERARNSVKEIYLRLPVKRDDVSAGPKLFEVIGMEAGMLRDQEQQGDSKSKPGRKYTIRIRNQIFMRLVELL